jgi:alcohol dehydrogenase YqhD (iron-dependent ADH family)
MSPIPNLQTKENALPFGTVLTLPATGNMNSGAVVTIEATKEKTDIRWFCFVSKILYVTQQ